MRPCARLATRWSVASARARSTASPAACATTPSNASTGYGRSSARVDGDATAARDAMSSARVVVAARRGVGSRRGARATTRRATPNDARSDELVRASARAAADAKAAVTRRNVRATVEARKRADEEREAAAREEAAAEKRARAEARAAAIGGRRPFHRKAGPIAAAGAACLAATAGCFEATVHAGDWINALAVPGDALVGASGAPAKSGLLTLTIGVGLTVTSTLAFSTAILFALAFQEGKGVIKNEPIVYYRCDGADPTCCVNGPHNKGYHERFVYMNHGRGFETRRAGCMQRHLRVSRGCSALKPLIVYPKDEDWGFW
jgi:hypothetical protein